MTFIKVTGLHIPPSSFRTFALFQKDPLCPLAVNAFLPWALQPQASVDLSASAAGAASYCVARSGLLPVFVNSFIGTQPRLFIDLPSVAAFSNNCRVKETDCMSLKA